MLALVAVLLSACGGGGGEAPSSPPPAVAPGTWVVLGSSTAAGANATAGNAWAARLAADMAARGVTMTNLARGGITTYQALPAAASRPAGRPVSDVTLNVEAALARQPRLVLLSFPSNDTALGYAVEETVANLLAMRSVLMAGGASVMVLSSQPRDLADGLRDRLREVDDRLAAAVGACFVAVRADLSAPDGRIDARFDAGDGVHLNDAGHAVVLSRVQARLQSGECVQRP
ncbi:SGNH/GDSL hydrolase family protein [Aquabacterium sp. J223]|uniref:SGNH/GDSL hydrolase family protein n=1 Tax=Aquabacterium sp. J223 TaxID=2898431 RepID=UPI0021ADCF37|nr:SGNH/GDSL hydrolase family protein [Aquabacterium sp. J223]UUX94132.1 SGNH/GDSL hydrolase family protein [Aquabacterium sp. J223]